jgi:hypothetical protein
MEGSLRTEFELKLTRRCLLTLPAVFCAEGQQQRITESQRLTFHWYRPDPNRNDRGGGSQEIG